MRTQRFIRTSFNDSDDSPKHIFGFVSFHTGALSPRRVFDQDLPSYGAFTDSIVKVSWRSLVDLDNFTSRIWQSNLISSDVRRGQLL
jgi:hypothetical protein